MVIPREPLDKTQGYGHEWNRVGLRRDYTRTPQITKVYLLGLLHDATVRKTTYRIATKNNFFALILMQGIKKFGQGAWIYKEGKNRNLWIVEFSKSLLKNSGVMSTQDKVDYVRGFFDAEGGIAKSNKVNFYIYFCQKNKDKLLVLKGYLTDLEIQTGIIHNPSRKVDPNYWRFYIKARSFRDFSLIVSSNHPEKFPLLWKKI